MLAIPSFIGHIVSGYRIEQLIAQGQASIAFRMRHPVSRQTATFTVALLPGTLSQQAFTAFMARFVSLAARFTALSHEHLLPVLDYGEYCGYPYLITAGAEGTSVATVLKHHGRYSPENALNVLRQVASALDYIHAHGIVHGNLRPATLLFQQEQQLRLSGLGMIHLLAARGIFENLQPYSYLCNLMGTYLGDPTYLAPEFVQGGPVDARSDLYALGLLFFELLSGKPPFSGRDYLDIALQHIKGSPLSFASRCPELKLPPQFDLLLGRALAYAPEQRFGKAAEMISAYERILEEQSEVSFVPPDRETGALEQKYLDNALSAIAELSVEMQSVPAHRRSAAVANDASLSEQRSSGNETVASGSQSAEPPDIPSGQPEREETTGQRALIVFPRRGVHAGLDQEQTIRQSEPQAEHESQLVTQGGAPVLTTLPAQPTQRERDIALLRQIEEYIWNEQELPTLSQAEPMLVTPLGPLFPARPQRRLSWRGVLCLALLIVILVLSCIGLGAWGMEQFQHRSVQPVPPQQSQQQRPVQSNNVQGSQKLNGAALFFPGGSVLINYGGYHRVTMSNSYSHK